MQRGQTRRSLNVLRARIFIRFGDAGVGAVGRTKRGTVDLFNEILGRHNAKANDFFLINEFKK
jgi:hypothetical protein